MVGESSKTGVRKHFLSAVEVLHDRTTIFLDEELAPLLLVLFCREEMGGRGSKNTSTSHTTRPARRDSSPIRPDVVPVEPTPSQPDTKRPGTSFKGVVSFRDGPAAVKFEALGSRDTLQFISDTEVNYT